MAFYCGEGLTKLGDGELSKVLRCNNNKEKLPFASYMSLLLSGSIEANLHETASQYGQRRLAVSRLRWGTTRSWTWEVSFACRWGVRLPQSFRKLPGLPRTSPNFPEDIPAILRNSLDVVCLFVANLCCLCILPFKLWFRSPPKFAKSGLFVSFPGRYRRLPENPRIRQTPSSLGEYRWHGNWSTNIFLLSLSLFYIWIFIQWDVFQIATNLKWIQFAQNFILLLLS